MNTALYTPSVEHLSSYLKQSGWKLVNKNNRCFVFEGYVDADGNPFEIVLPLNERAPDYPVYAEHTIRILSALTDKAEAVIANEIRFFDHDVLVIDTDASSVDFAATQIPPIKRLIGHSANMERSLKPHFNQYYIEARNMLRHFEISHQLNGRVSYRVESQVGEKEAYQKKLFRDTADPGEILPLQRRVVERIATGLLTLEQATKSQKLQLLIESYADGFNANMCNAILEISKHSAVPVQYSVDWARKLRVSDGVKIVRNIQIERPHLEYLKRTRDKLKEFRPEFQRIEGRVIGLSSSVDPQSDDVDIDERSIVVLRTDRRKPNGKLRIHLGRNDYLKAIKAHEDWATISVDGVALKRRSGWQLSDPQDFKILR